MESLLDRKEIYFIREDRYSTLHVQEHRLCAMMHNIQVCMQDTLDCKMMPTCYLMQSCLGIGY